MDARILIQQGMFLTFAEPRLEFSGWLVIADGKIAAMGEGKAPDVQLNLATERVDGTGLLFMPGLVNTHGHTPMTLLRGVADDLVLQDWLQHHIWPIEEKFTAQDVFWGSSLAMVEMIKSGTTTFVDMYDHMEQVAQVVSQSGLRASLTRGVIGFGSDEQKAQKLREAIQFAKDWHGQANDRIHTMMSPHSPYTCMPKYIEKFVTAAHDLDLPIHTHLSETAAEVAQNLQEYGLRPVELLDRLGVFARPTLLAHAVHLNDQEIALLAERKVAVSHNPISNLKLGSGIARVPEMLSAGIKISLGTDGVASNNNLDLFQEITMTSLLHKGVTQDPTVISAEKSLRMATQNGAEAIGCGKQIGRLKVGMKADIIALDVRGPNFTPLTNMVSHLVYAAHGSDVKQVWVDGKQLLKNGQLLTMDEEKIKAEVNQCYRRLKL